MKKNILYIVIAVSVGLLSGYLIFGRTIKKDSAVKDVSDTHEHESMEEFWTCSMHPQVMKTEPGDCPICGMDLIPAAAGDQSLDPNEIRMTKNAMALANIQTSVVGDGEGEGGTNGLSLSGKIAQNEEKISVQASYFDGRIEKLNVTYEGQNIQKGQLLATIYAPDLVAAQQELLTAGTLKKDQPSLYNAVRNKLKLWKLSENQINSIEKSGRVLENFPVYATVSGTVSQVMSAAGDYVKRGQPLLKVSNLNTVWAEFDAYENQIAQLKKGDTIAIIANSYSNKNFKAQISFIEPMLDTQSRTVRVRATLNNPEGLLKPGMFVTGNVSQKDGSSSAGLIIPASAVLWTGERSLVYVKTDKNTPLFEMREVTLGNRSGENYNIASGLTAGEEVVTNGTFTIDAAAQLQDKKSMMNQVGEASAMKGMPMELSKNFQLDFQLILPDYMVLKEAFVSSNDAQISAVAKKMVTAMKKINIASLKNMVQSHVNTIIKTLQDIETENKLEEQRKAFAILNENFVPITKALKGLSQEIYIQKCPMAANNKGALWLSDKKIIKNPYYGEVMINCGSVIDSIK
ncbi:MAG TPA: efflux RND transporter periplasmic adaptor subunit [Leeuwenhoekiella sp.]|nr:efflux RND transporter periplasmic adaptor subunit [Leeuwenhoekiella sp.]